jgi:hypothetical protein
MAEAHKGAQQFSQISLACPSSREVVIEIKIAGSDTRLVTYRGGECLKVRKCIRKLIACLTV